MAKFVARETELQNLNKMYKSARFEMAVIYGRRRIGKTALIEQFIKDKPAIYMQGIEATSSLNLRYFSEAILNFAKPNRLNKNFTFSDYKDALTEVQDIANSQEQKLILVLDEFPYLAEADRAISSILQYVIDHVYQKYDNVMLILCGSSMSFMEHQVLGYKSPLYGRRTGEFKLQAFNLFDSKKILPHVSNEDLLAYYGITGGIPQYLSFIDPALTVNENIQKLFLNQNAPLQNEPNILLQEELRKPATYFSILTAIANGKTKNNDIAQAIGFANSSLISPYLASLNELEIIKRKQPIFEKNSRKYVYAFQDSMFRFWFRFIAGSQDQIALGKTTSLLEKIMMELPDFLGPVFEKASKDWLWQQTDLPFTPRIIKSWWGNNPILKKQEEIDLVASNTNDTQAIIGECKWRKASNLKREMIPTLIERARLVPKIKQTYLYFFVKDATIEFIKMANNYNITVVKYADFFD